MTRQHDIAWDDPEEYPEDEEEGMAPGDEPQTETGAWGDDVVYDSQPSPNWDADGAAELRRQRRRQRINDHLLTREYRERRKAELREERGGRFA